MLKDFTEKMGTTKKLLNTSSSPPIAYKRYSNNYEEEKPLQQPQRQEHSYQPQQQEQHVSKNNTNNTCLSVKHNTNTMFTKLKNYFTQFRTTLSTQKHYSAQQPRKHHHHHQSYRHEKLTECNSIPIVQSSTSNILNIVTIVVTLIFLASFNGVTSSPVFVDNPSLAQFQSGRNIRHLPCIVRKSGRSGVCMFAIDCIKQNGTHLGTCIDRFYFGSCCDIKEEELTEIADNSIDQNTISHHFTPESSTVPTSALFKLTTLGSLLQTDNMGITNNNGGSTSSITSTSSVTSSSSSSTSTSGSRPSSNPATQPDVTQTFASTTLNETPRPTTFIAHTSTGKPTKPTKTTTTAKPALQTTHKQSHFVVRTTAKPTKYTNRVKPSHNSTTKKKTTSSTTTKKTTTASGTTTAATTTTTKRPLLTTADTLQHRDELPIEATTIPTKLFTYQIVETTAFTPSEATNMFDFITTDRTTMTSSKQTTKQATKATTTKPKETTTTTTTETATTQKFTTIKPKPQTTRKPSTTKKPTSIKRTTSKTTRRPATTTTTTTTTPAEVKIHVNYTTETQTSSTYTTSKISSTTANRTTLAPRPKPKPTASIVRVPKPTTTTTSATTSTSTSTTTTSTTPSTTAKTLSTTTEVEKIEQTTTSTFAKLPTQTTPTTTTTTTTTSATTTTPRTTATTTQKTTTHLPVLPSTTHKPGLVTWTNIDGEPVDPNQPIISDWVPVTSVAPLTTHNKVQESASENVTFEEMDVSVSSSVSAVMNNTTIIISPPQKPVLMPKPTTSTSTSTTTTSTTDSPASTASSAVTTEQLESTTAAFAESSTQFSTEGLEGFTPSSSITTPSSVSTEETTTDNFSVNATTTASTLEGVDYRQVCGRRMFPEPRIVGGSNAAFGRWPWQISLRQWRTSTYLHKCGAALLNENWAITAAHCVDNVPPSDLLLRLGEYDLAEEEEPYGYQERRVQIVASHPQFDPRTFEYDLALLRFYEPVVFQPNIIPVCVPENDEDFIGQTAFVTGWGRLYEDGPLPSVLQEVAVPVINNTICESMYRAAGYIEHIPHIFICAGWKKGGYDSCEGDSGGPMVLQRESDKRFQLGGVISWGIGCAEANQPGVYTRISEFRDWINQILQF